MLKSVCKYKTSTCFGLFSRPSSGVSSAVFCAVTVPPADLRSLSLYYYTVSGRMCMLSVIQQMTYTCAVLCAVTIPPADLRLLSLYYYTVCGRMFMSSVIQQMTYTSGHILCNNTDSKNANQREE
jgi:hypothetical protein